MGGTCSYTKNCLSFFLLRSYICYLIFQLITHPEAVPEESDDEESASADSAAKDGHDILSVPSAICFLALISVTVAIHCE